MKTKTKNKKKIGKRILKILLIALMIIAILVGIAAVVNVIGIKSNKNFASSVGKTEYESQLVPELDEQNGYYTFTTDRNFKIMQLTDVHIGGGFMSIKKDNMAINAVAAMVKEEKPDLVIVTGDIAYPVPFQAGTFNNKSGAEIFAELMETLGVYWAPVYGNHDTEAYSYYSREDISELYSNKEKYPHCLFQSGDESVDGWGNYIINVKNSKGEITQSLYMLDSNSYL
ncbi:MAG: metallophosphoesterase, partial [Eubacterium sp.]